MNSDELISSDQAAAEEALPEVDAPPNRVTRRKKTAIERRRRKRKSAPQNSEPLEVSAAEDESDEDRRSPEEDRRSSLRYVDRILSEAETATIVGVSPMTLRRMHSQGRGPPRLRLSLRRIGYRASDVERWLRQVETAA